MRRSCIKLEYKSKRFNDLFFFVIECKFIVTSSPECDVKCTTLKHFLLQETEALMKGLQSLHGWLAAQSKINPRPATKRKIKLELQEEEVATVVLMRQHL